MLCRIDMLAQAQGGRAATVLGLAGAGDLYVTGGHGRNGRFGRLLGSGATVEGAVRSIGSTVEGLVSPGPALRLAEPAGLELPTARVVELALKEDLTGERVSDRLRDLLPDRRVRLTAGRMPGLPEITTRARMRAVSRRRRTFGPLPPRGGALRVEVAEELR
jgi:hypothetical protein